MAWVILFLAGIFEVGWAVGLKYTDGFSRLWPSLLTLSALLISFALLGVAMKTLPMSTAYAVWVGIGMLGTAVLGLLLGDSMSLLRLASLGLITLGVLGLKMTG
ncbi:MAG: quaternary ammonium compound efflux SMR transporter SugE [Halopseudomonas sp.]|uniref:quaternary ammonium compound efflux SMR transporter SugE n=1 Tax=Halopseudomonas sp. TaxID=2901191 RepID=UPI003002762C